MRRNEDAGQPRNSPAAILGVLLLVFGVVGVVALAGKATKPISGVAIAAPRHSGDVVRAPVGSAPSGETGVGALAEPGADPLVREGIALPAGTCELPQLHRSAARLRAFYDALLGCLDDGWRPALLETGAWFRVAGLDVASDATSDCGQMPDEDEATAFYCGADRVIYMPRGRLLEYLGLYEPAHLAVLAHEYGHHVQNLSGVLGAVEESVADVRPGSARELELSRRVELQANCFAGLFLASVAGRGSITEQESAQAVEEFGNSVDSDTHGTVRNQLRWARTGFDGRTTAVCDTWSAAPEAVA